MDNFSLLIHPGETIADVLSERNISTSELARLSGISEGSLLDVVHGRKSITEALATGLERALEVPESFWLNLQHDYNAARIESQGTPVAYTLRDVDTDGCNLFLLLLDFQSVFYYLGMLKNDPALSGAGYLIIDHLLATGNGDNRFWKCHYRTGELDGFELLRPTMPMRQMSLCLLRENIERLEYSILTHAQMAEIQSGTDVPVVL